MRCPRCNASIIEGGKFCGNCGFSIAAPPMNAIPNQTPPQWQEKATGRKKRNLLIPLLCVGLVLGVFFFTQTRETLTVGEEVQFGGYTWRVLDVQGGRALLLSEYVINHRAYHHTWEDVTWEQSSLRHWLNNEFFNNNFNTSDRARIAQTYVVNNNNPWFGTPGGNNTHDRIFLLSLEEVVRYFGDSGQLANRPSQDAWGISDGFNVARIARCANGRTSWWWLRSPGFGGYIAADVGLVGHVLVSGGGVDDDRGGVRPALWLYL